jgi:hypothetical protein
MVMATRRNGTDTEEKKEKKKLQGIKEKRA